MSERYVCPHCGVEAEEYDPADKRDPWLYYGFNTTPDGRTMRHPPPTATKPCKGGMPMPIEDDPDEKPEVKLTVEEVTLDTTDGLMWIGFDTTKEHWGHSHVLASVESTVCFSSDPTVTEGTVFPAKAVCDVIVDYNKDGSLRGIEIIGLPSGPESEAWKR